MPRDIQGVDDKAAAQARYKAWYERTMADPVKRATLLAKRRDYKAKRKASGSSPPPEAVVSQPGELTFVPEGADPEINLEDLFQ
jgi:hypothetical protein